MLLKYSLANFDKGDDAMFNKKPKEMVVVFLTESGHSPDARTTRHYTGVFVSDKRMTDGNKNLLFSSLGGPTLNQPANLLQAMTGHTGKLPLFLAILIGSDECCVVEVDEELIVDFGRIAGEDSSKTSWQIAKYLVEQRVD